MQGRGVALGSKVIDRKSVVLNVRVQHVLNVIVGDNGRCAGGGDPNADCLRVDGIGDHAIAYDLIVSAGDIHEVSGSPALQVAVREAAVVPCDSDCAPCSVDTLYVHAHDVAVVAADDDPRANTARPLYDLIPNRPGVTA